MRKWQRAKQAAKDDVEKFRDTDENVEQFNGNVNAEGDVAALEYHDSGKIGNSNNSYDYRQFLHENEGNRS